MENAARWPSGSSSRKAMCRSAKYNLGIDSVRLAVVREHVKQAIAQLQAVLGTLQIEELSDGEDA